MVSGIEQRHIVASDGTTIGYQIRHGDPSQLPLVFANGLGGTYLAFQHVYSAAPQRTVVCWDYRGLYSSAQPSDASANTVVHQVGDLSEILAAEGIAEFAMAGWSMGVQVCLEAWRMMPEQIRGLLLINGTYGKPFSTVLGSKLIGSTIPTLVKLMKMQSTLVGAVTRRVAGTRSLVTTMRSLGMVSKTIDVEIFRAVAGGFETIDWKIYADLLNRLNQHDAQDVMPSVTVPTEIISADRDILTPPTTAAEMKNAIPNSELTVIAGGTHYTPVEYPQEVGNVVRRWLLRIEQNGKTP